MRWQLGILATSFPHHLARFENPLLLGCFLVLAQGCDSGETDDGPSAGGGGDAAVTLAAGTGNNSTGGSVSGAAGTIDATSAGSGGEAVAGTGNSGPLALEGEPCTGYTFFGVPENDGGADTVASIIDMDGNEIHRWPITGFVPKMLPGGSLLGCTGVSIGSYDCREIRQVTWDGTLEWSFSNWFTQTDGTMSARLSHDLEREGNPIGSYAPGQDFVDQGNTLVLAHFDTTVPGIRPDPLEDDAIYEVDWSGQFTGFEWHAADHVAEFGFDQYALDDIATRSPGSKLEWLHGNSVSRLGSNPWYDAGNATFHPDNILYSSRNGPLLLIISHTTGEVLWRVGPEFAGRPEEGLGQFAGQHAVHMIPRGLPGAGNILVFDNGCCAGWGQMVIDGTYDRYHRGYSRVVEFNPVTFELVWEYGAADGIQNFFSPYLSNAQRLPNGNTLITVGMDAHVFEVTPDKQIVWEHDYVPTGTGARSGWLHRSIRVPPEWLPAGVNESLGNYDTWASLFGG